MTKDRHILMTHETAGIVLWEFSAEGMDKINSYLAD
jgi:hypothetical protein